MKDYYKVLEIDHTATYDEIKRSYRRLALKYHPDRNSGNKESQRLFTEINHAYKTLSNEESRKRYDITYKIKLSNKEKVITPQIFLEKFVEIRNFISNKGKRKINQTVLVKALINLLSDNNIKYLHLKADSTIKQQIIEEALKCCNFLTFQEMGKITNRLLLLADSDIKMVQTIYTYIENHKSMNHNKFIETLVNLTHKFSTIFR